MADAATIGEQVQVVRLELDRGVPPSEMVGRFAVLWEVCEDTVRGRIRAARAQIGRLTDDQRIYERGKDMTRAEMLWATNVREENWAVCLKVLEYRAKMLGLNAPLQVEDVTDKDRPMHEWPSDRLATRYAELRGNGGARPN